MRFRKSIFATLALLAFASGSAVAQEASTPPVSNIAREALEEAWFTGPMLAPSAATLPTGHFLIEPYLYDVTTQGFYNRDGARVSALHSNGFGSLTYILYGVANRFTVGVIPTFGYNTASGSPSSSAPAMGDVSLQGQYRIRQFHEGSWMPMMSFAVQEALPTGKYDELGDRLSNGLGSGAYTTTLALYSQTYFWLPNGRILRVRFNVTQSFSRTVNVEGASVYGTQAGFSGHANPGSASFVDASWEYSLRRNWVLALDATYRYENNTRVTGIDSLDPSQARVQLDSGSSDAVGFAPAVEYNLNAKVGILLGTRIIAAGRNTAFTISPAIAINIVH
jgi:hypothetical protein